MGRTVVLSISGNCSTAEAEKFDRDRRTVDGRTRTAISTAKLGRRGPLSSTISHFIASPRFTSMARPYHNARNSSTGTPPRRASKMVPNENACTKYLCRLPIYGTVLMSTAPQAFPIHPSSIFGLSIRRRHGSPLLRSASHPRAASTGPLSLIFLLLSRSFPPPPSFPGRYLIVHLGLLQENPLAGLIVLCWESFFTPQSLPLFWTSLL